MNDAPEFIIEPRKSPAQWDEQFLRFAIRIGMRNAGLTWPNPSVGAVVVSTGTADTPEILGLGITQPGGRPHAERMLLERLGERAAGATLYVSLEPCSHQGKSAPCVDIVIASGIRRVVAALRDPDPRVSGRGFAALRAHGIEVVENLLAPEAAAAHVGHISRVTRRSPYVTAKLAMSRDGFVGVYGRGSVGISCPRTLDLVHMWRAKADAIMIGAGTARNDDPLLTVRLPGMENRSPVRVVVDSNLSLAPDSRLAQTAQSVPVWALCGEPADRQRAETLTGKGVKILEARRDGTGHVDILHALELLAGEGVTTVFCEGGPTLLTSMFRSGAVDRFILSSGATDIGPGGVPALNRTMTSILMESFRCTGTLTVDTDRIRFFERVGN
ncbi:MAG: bifunctional diaminohydroxyphosphoribosylaminopyrimidine deaminase/5-amino-6-(5-phosphoribosylamino)uracil reductase RibD [Methylobacteriaceae bacterium]|nr:bifunctional diaminohydroxyphosphoribosylaminopyrimidine deaminase/5-amino-6-(5-phosphoribosylamino)uracil reductase RibD [Methylobacteriaceae bacterium]